METIMIGIAGLLAITYIGLAISSVFAIIVVYNYITGRKK